MKQRIASVIQGRSKSLILAICVGVGLGAFAVPALGSFGRARNFAVGTGPLSVAIGDFNGDARRDLAVVNSGSGTVSILLGNGAGSFGRARNFAVGTTPRSVAVGNFNGDAKLDLAVTNFSSRTASSNTVSILLGKGDGAFGEATNFPVGAKPESVAVSDFNGDGNADLAVANRAPATVSILLGNGDGTFAPATDFAVATKPYSVAVGDFNHDGQPDLVTADYVKPGSVSVLLGNGDGTFGPVAYFATGERSSEVAVGDFNGDSNPDLAVANVLSEDVSILLGRGDGSFGAARNFAVGALAGSIAVGDLNGDRKLDLAVPSSPNPIVHGRVSILLGNGDGSFIAPKRFRVFPVGPQPSSVAIGNLNAGSNLDLAVANYGSGGAPSNVSVLLNGGPSPRTLTLSYRANRRRFTGRLRSADPTCVRSQRVRLLRRRSGSDEQVGTAISTRSGTYAVRREARPGTYYARVRGWSACRAENSKLVTVR